jgi:hypothetical protein
MPSVFIFPFEMYLKAHRPTMGARRIGSSSHPQFPSFCPADETSSDETCRNLSEPKNSADVCPLTAFGALKSRQPATAGRANTEATPRIAKLVAKAATL